MGLDRARALHEVQYRLQRGRLYLRLALGSHQRRILLRGRRGSLAKLAWSRYCALLRAASLACSQKSITQLSFRGSGGRRIATTRSCMKSCANLQRHTTGKRLLRSASAAADESACTPSTVAHLCSRYSWSSVVCLSWYHTFPCHGLRRKGRRKETRREEEGTRGEFESGREKRGSESSARHFNVRVRSQVLTWFCVTSGTHGAANRGLRGSPNRARSRMNQPI